MKKYNLKPGKHQFAPGSHAVHENDNISDEEAEWYLQRYPHRASLFTPRPPEGGANNDEEEKMKINITRKQKTKEVSSLTPPSGGRGAP